MEYRMSEVRDEKKRSLEETFAEIESIIEQMEQPQISLDESFLLYQRGIGQLKVCNEMLDEVEKKMQVLNADGCLEEM